MIHYSCAYNTNGTKLINSIGYKTIASLSQQANEIYYNKDGIIIWKSVSGTINIHKVMQVKNESYKPNFPQQLPKEVVTIIKLVLIK